MISKSVTNTECHCDSKHEVVVIVRSKLRVNIVPEIVLHKCNYGCYFHINIFSLKWATTEHYLYAINITLTVQRRTMPQMCEEENMHKIGALTSKLNLHIRVLHNDTEIVNMTYGVR